MNVVFRCYAANAARVELAYQSIRSAIEHRLHCQGQLCVQNGAGTCDSGLRAICREIGNRSRFDILYRHEEDTDIKQGFIRALQLAGADQQPVLVCTDDLVFGRGTADVLHTIETQAIPHFVASAEQPGLNWGLISLFACYPRRPRDQWRNAQGQTLPLCELPANTFYGGIAIILRPRFARELMEEWAQVQAGRLPAFQGMEDIWLNRRMTERGYRWLNTMADFAYHTGNDARVARADGSQYQTDYFVGE
jgi:hypothetical protein